MNREPQPQRLQLTVSRAAVLSISGLQARPFQRALRRTVLSKTMPTRRNLKAQPRMYLKDPNEKWLEGDLVGDAPQVAHFARKVAQRLRDRLAEDDAPTAYAAAQAADISRQTVANILEGNTWSDLPTIYRLEVAVKHRLWFNEDH